LKLDLDKNQNVIIFQLIKFFKLIVFVSRIILKFFTQKPELIIATHINFSVLAYLAKILFKIQYIVIAHGLEINSRISKFQLIALNNSEKIISVSQWTQNRLLQLGININKIVIIGNTAPEKIFHPKYSTKNLRYFYNFGVKKAVDELCVIHKQEIIAKAMDGCVSYCIQVKKHIL
jgi:hypothetical protein